MSTEGILLNHNGLLSGGSSRPVGGISTFSEKQYDLIISNSNSSNPTPYNINGQTYFTRVDSNNNIYTIGFYKYNDSIKALEKINDICRHSSDIQDYTLFTFKNNLYCCPIAYRNGSKTLYRYKEGASYWIVEPNLNISEGGIQSAAELNGTLYLVQNFYPESGSHKILLQTTDLINFTEANNLEGSTNYSYNYYLHPFQGTILIAKYYSDTSYNSASLYFEYFTDPSQIKQISLDDSFYRPGFSYVNKNQIIVSCQEQIILLEINDKFALSNKVTLWSKGESSNYAYKVFIDQNNTSMGQLGNQNFYLLTPQDNILTQYLLKGNKILVEKIKEVELLSNNIIKKDNFIEVIEEGVVKIKLNKIPNYNGSRTQNFLIF